MQKAKQDALIHISLLVVAQWISIGVIVLNAIALGGAPDTGLISSTSGPQDFLLLVLGSVSLVGASALLCLHLHVFFRLIDDRPYAPSRTLLASEMTVAVIQIALWASATSVVMTNFRMASPCRVENSPFVLEYSQACGLVSVAVMLAFVAVAAWVIIILATLLTLTQSIMHDSATIFTVEAPSLTYLPKTYDTTTLKSPSPAHNNTMLSRDEKHDLKSMTAYHSKTLPTYGRESDDASDRSSYMTRYHHISWEHVSLDDLPTIQVGMSQMNLSFWAEDEYAGSSQKLRV